MAVLGPCFCARAFSSCSKRGPLFIAVCGPLIIAASPVAEHRLQTCRLSNCGSRAQLLRGMWDLPRPGLEPVSPALAGSFSTTTPPGKPQLIYTLSVFPLFDFLGVYQTLCLVSVLPRGTKRKEFCLHLNQKAKKKTAFRGASKKSTSSND